MSTSPPPSSDHDQGSRSSSPHRSSPRLSQPFALGPPTATSTGSLPPLFTRIASSVPPAIIPTQIHDSVSALPALDLPSPHNSSEPEGSMPSMTTQLRRQIHHTYSMLTPVPKRDTDSNLPLSVARLNRKTNSQNISSPSSSSHQHSNNNDQHNDDNRQQHNHSSSSAFSPANSDYLERVQNDHPEYFNVDAYMARHYDNQLEHNVAVLDAKIHQFDHRFHAIDTTLTIICDKLSMLHKPPTNKNLNASLDNASDLHDNSSNNSHQSRKIHSSTSPSRQSCEEPTTHNQQSTQSSVQSYKNNQNKNIRFPPTMSQNTNNNKNKNSPSTTNPTQLHIPSSSAFPYQTDDTNGHINPSISALQSGNKSRSTFQRKFCQCCMTYGHASETCFLRGPNFRPKELNQRINVFNMQHGDKPPVDAKLPVWNPSSPPAMIAPSPAPVSPLSPTTKNVLFAKSPVKSTPFLHSSLSKTKLRPTVNLLESHPTDEQLSSSCDDNNITPDVDIHPEISNFIAEIDISHQDSFNHEHHCDIQQYVIATMNDSTTITNTFSHYELHPMLQPMIHNKQSSGVFVFTPTEFKYKVQTYHQQEHDSQPSTLYLR